MQITVNQLADLLKIYTGRSLALTALGVAEPGINDVASARVYMDAERDRRLNIANIKADPLTESLFGGFDARWGAEVDLLNSADRLIDAVAAVVGAPPRAYGFAIESS